MNCQKCNGTMTSANKVIRGRPTVVYECNQDNGDCLNPKGYPTSVFGNASNGARPSPAAPQRANGGGDTGQAWGNAKNAAAQLMSGAGAASFDEFLALARKIYAATPTVAKPKPAPVQEQEPQEEEVY